VDELDECTVVLHAGHLARDELAHWHWHVVWQADLHLHLVSIQGLKGSHGLQGHFGVLSVHLERQLGLLVNGDQVTALS